MRALTTCLAFHILLAASACQEAAPGDPAIDPDRPVVLSLLGERLEPRADSTAAVARAVEALAADSADVELLLSAGHAYAAVWDYVEAIRLYSRAIDAAPGDWRGYRFRGHRYVSIRRLPNALRDLEAARDLSPHSFDVAYHLGLAYYTAGTHDSAAQEYGRCLALANDPDALQLESTGTLGTDFRSCMSIATDDNARVAITDWRYRALRRAGHDEEAASLLDGITPDMSVSTNTAYHHVLLFYKGLKAAEELLDPANPASFRFETVAYPIATWHLVEGDTAQAILALERVAADPWWPGFGRIAAESDLVALRPSNVR